MVKDHRDETEHSLLPLHRYSPISYKESIIYMHHPTEYNTYHDLCYTSCGRMKEGNVLFNDGLNTFYLQLCGVTYGKGPLI